MSRASLLLRGVEPPEVGSIRDRIMTRMYAMEQAQKADDMQSLGLIVAIASRADTAVMQNLQGFLDAYRERSGYQSWSNERKDIEVAKQRSDEDIMAAVDKLGEL